MERVIYGDVLVAINFIVNLLILNLTRRLTGVPVKSWRRYLGALVGSLCSFAIFLPLSGLWWDLLLRLFSTAVVMLATYGDKPLPTLLRLSAVFFTVGFLLAGFVMGAYFLLPKSVFYYRSGAFYLHVTPLVLLGCIVCAYLFVSVFDHIFDRGNSRDCIWQCSISRGGGTVMFPVFLDTGNHLVEPFSGLPVLVVGVEHIRPLLTTAERAYLAGQETVMPPGMRPVFYSGVGSEGLLSAFRPDQLTMTKNGRTVEAEGYLAVSRKRLECGDCCGVFNPTLLGIEAMGMA